MDKDLLLPINSSLNLPEYRYVPGSLVVFQTFHLACSPIDTCLVLVLHYVPGYLSDSFGFPAPGSPQTAACGTRTQKRCGSSSLPSLYPHDEEEYKEMSLCIFLGSSKELLQEVGQMHMNRFLFLSSKRHTSYLLPLSPNQQSYIENCKLFPLSCWDFSLWPNTLPSSHN